MYTIIGQLSLCDGEGRDKALLATYLVVRGPMGTERCMLSSHTYTRQRHVTRGARAGRRDNIRLDKPIEVRG